MFRPQDSSINNDVEPEDYAKLGSNAFPSTVSKDSKEMHKKMGAPAATRPESAAAPTAQQTVSTNATREQPKPNKTVSSSVSKVVTISTSSSKPNEKYENAKNKTKSNGTKLASVAYLDQEKEGSSSVGKPIEYYESTEIPTTTLAPSEEMEENLSLGELSISQQLAMIPTGSVDIVAADSATTELPLKQEPTAAPLNVGGSIAMTDSVNSSLNSGQVSSDVVVPYVEETYPDQADQGHGHLPVVHPNTVQSESMATEVDVVTTALPESSVGSSTGGSSSSSIQMEATEEELSSGSLGIETTALPLDDDSTVNISAQTTSTPLPAAMTQAPPQKETTTETLMMMPGSYYANKSPLPISGLSDLQVVTETAPSNNHSNVNFTTAAPLTSTTTVASAVTVIASNGSAISTKQPSISNHPTEQNYKKPAVYSGTF